MRLKTLDLLLIVTILAIPLFAGWSYFHPRMTRMEQQSISDECDGLQLAIRSLERQGDEVKIIYTFRWAAGKERTFGFFRNHGFIDVLFFDSNRQPIDGPPDDPPLFILKDSFVYGNGTSSEQQTLVSAPAGAKYVAVKYSVLATKKVAIPEAGEAP
jgi:hypothetical protein